MSFIEYRGVSKSFGSKKIFEDLSLSIEKGETMTIIGGSGTGKTIMLKLLLKLMLPNRGDILFEGKDIFRMDETQTERLRTRMGMLFQGGALFDSLSVRGNIAYPLHEHFHLADDEIDRRVAQKLALVGLPGIEGVMPADLSGGMKKRVALARAIATDPEVILYDEPTTGLDPTNTRRINNLIRDLQKKLKVTSIVVTHDMESAFTIADRLALLANGTIAFVGTPDEAKRSSNKTVRNFIEGLIGE